MTSYPMEDSLGARLLDALKRQGARALFGIPGDFILPFFRIAEATGTLPLYTLSHEPSAGFAADAAARHGLGIGVVAATYGAGALNLVNAVACAYAERSPVVVIAGAPSSAERHNGLLLHHQVKSLDSQINIFREITCDQARLDDAETAPAEIRRVLASCRRRSLPVYIELPRDMAAASCRPVGTVSPDTTDGVAIASVADAILARLGRAKSPLIMVDVEVRRHEIEHKVAELACRLGVPIVTSLLGRGLLAGSRAQVLGTYLGRAGARSVAQRVESADALLLLGVLPTDTNFRPVENPIDWDRVLHVAGGIATIDGRVHSDLPMEPLIDAMLERVPFVGTISAEPVGPEPSPIMANDAAIEPSDIARALDHAMRAFGRMPIAADIGDCLFAALEIANTPLVAPGYYATMGFGIPAGLGIQAATGERPVILVGDGAFQMTGWELGNCRRYGWDPIVIVFNNAGWEMLRAFEPAARFNDLDDWGYADLAQGLGGVGIRVSTTRELEAALRDVFGQRGRFQLIEAMVARGTRSRTLDQFVKALATSTTA